VPETDRLTVESPYVRRAARAERRIRLFCLPYAGAGASSYAEWPRLLPPEIEVVAVQLPGREDRLGEAPFTRVAPAVRTIGLALRPYLQGPFAFFGHSSGALLAFELARALRQRTGMRPAHLVLSSQPPPDAERQPEPMHHLPDAEFRAALRGLGGTAHSVFDDEDLMPLLLPALRADFALCENHRFVSGPPLSSPITVFGSPGDSRAPVADLHGWRRHTDDAFHLRLFDGGHFYLNDAADEITAAIGATLLDPALAAGR
jgi:medium-chain acyl-[acyl-carrier-protein] hydrolase